MKSIFSILFFIVLAVIFSQPEKSTHKYIPVSFTFHSNINSDNSTEAHHLNLFPNESNKSYHLILNKKLSADHTILSTNFNFEDCLISRRPEVSFNCTSSSKREAGEIQHFSIEPLMNLSTGKVNNYLLKIQLNDRKGNSKTYSYLSEKDNLNILNLDTKIKISKND